MKDTIVLRYILPEEAEQAADIEQICFPPNEACPYDAMVQRARAIPEQFLVAADQSNGLIAGFLNGIVTDEQAFRDEFFTDISLNDPDGKNVMLVGLDVRPQYRRQGIAGAIMKRYAAIETARGRRRLVLTCLEHLVPMYEHMGFRDLGISGSVWGGCVWHEMEYRLEP